MNTLLRVVSTATLLAATGVAAETDLPPLSLDLAETLRWFPADVDALLVASDFKLADATARWGDPEVRDAWLAQAPMPRIFRQYASGRGYRETDGGSSVPSDAARELRERAYVERIDEFWQVVERRRVEFAAMAAREVFPASAFGFCGYASCHVVRLSDALGADASPLAEKLRSGADSVAKIADREIAAFNWKFPKEPYIKTRPWEGFFILIPQPGDRELFIATQRRLLEEVLARRADDAAKREALPPELPEWKTLDVAASVWGIMAKPPADKRPPAARDVITFEYHTGNDARFILRAPSESLPDDPKTVDPYAKKQPPTPALFVGGLSRMEVDYHLDRPPGEPARVTVPFTGDARTVAQRAVPMTFLTGALFVHCIDPAR